MGKHSKPRKVKTSPKYTGTPIEELRTGDPNAYFDHIERTYGEAFRSGTKDGSETFYLLYQQISAVKNEQSTELFLSRFLPMLPRHARKAIINDIMPNARPKSRRDMA